MKTKLFIIAITALVLVSACNKNPFKKPFEEVLTSHKWFEKQIFKEYEDDEEESRISFSCELNGEGCCSQSYIEFLESGEYNRYDACTDDFMRIHWEHAPDYKQLRVHYITYWTNPTTNEELCDTSTFYYKIKKYNDDELILLLENETTGYGYDLEITYIAI